MRQAGTIDNEADAQRLAEYLLTIGIAARVLRESDGWSVWVRDEAQVERAKAELAAFSANRGDPKYAAAAPLARSIQKVESAREAQTRRNVVDMRVHWRKPAIGRTPVAMLLIFASIAVTLLTSFGGAQARDDARRAALLGRIWIAEPPLVGEATLEAVAHGELWRLVTPILLHLSPMHLLFNMMWLYHLGMVVEAIEGSWRFALLVLVVAVSSNLAQFYCPHPEALLTAQSNRIAIALTPSPWFGGMSGVVYGLFGYVWIRARRDPLSRYFMDDQTVLLMIVWFFVCLFGFVGPVANTAHGVGLLVGMAVGYGVAKLKMYRLRH
ncbi:MAG: rhomboid family intramembrane serine protease [Pirellulales bacterium]